MPKKGRRNLSPSNKRHGEYTQLMKKREEKTRDKVEEVT